MLKLKKIKPMFTSLVTTAEQYTEDETINGVIDMRAQKGALKNYQRVVAVGDSVRGIKVGDIVDIDPTRYAVMKHREGSMKDGIVTDNPVVGYNFKMVELGDVPHLLIEDRDVRYVIEEYEETKDSHIIKPDKKIVY